MKTLASVESFTGGLFAASISAIPGASQYFKGALVTYANEVKARLGIDVSQGVVNARTAKALARAGRAYFNVDVCVAFTGNAGPTALEQQPVGLVFIAFNEAVYELQLSGSRTEVRQAAVDFALTKWAELNR